MAFQIADRCQETSTTENTGTITLGGAVAGFQTFAAVGDGNTCFYTITDAADGAWEVGQGVYTASGTTLTRNLVASSTGSLIDWSAGTRNVFVSHPAHAAALTTAVKTSHYTATAADSIIMVNPAAATTITLPTAAAGTLGQRFKVHKVAGDYVVTVTDGGSSLVDGAANQYLYLAGDSFDLLCTHNGSAYIWLATSKHLQPHSAAVTQDSAQTISGGGAVGITFDSVDFEYGCEAVLTAGNEYIEVKRAGVYHAFVMVSIQVTSEAFCYVNVNGTALTDAKIVGIGYRMGNNYVVGSTLLDLSAADKLYASVYHNDMPSADTLVLNDRLKSRLQVMEVL